MRWLRLSAFFLERSAIIFFASLADTSRPPIALLGPPRFGLAWRPLPCGMGLAEPACPRGDAPLALPLEAGPPRFAAPVNVPPGRVCSISIK